jgi:uncharacterized protein YkwD
MTTPFGEGGLGDGRLPLGGSAHVPAPGTRWDAMLVRRAAVVAALALAPIGAVATTSSAVATAQAAAPAVAHEAVAVGNALLASDALVASVKKASKKKVKKKSKKKATNKKTVTNKKKASGPNESAVSPSTVESQVVALTNQQRAAHGCGALRVDGRLVAAARAHSTDMVTHNFFSHTGSDGSTFVTRAARAGYANASAENIAWGWRTAQIVVDQWMNSPGHRANILNCANVAVGVGLVTKADGTPYWTQDFGRV